MINKKLLIALEVILLAVTLAYVSGNVFFNTSSNKISIPSTESGLVGYWPLDGDNYNSVTNKTTDKTPYSNHGTNNGATLTSDRMGQSNGAMSFDGSNDYVSVGNNANLQLTNNMTISAWINTPLLVRSEIVWKHYNNEFDFGVEPAGGLNWWHGDGAWEGTVGLASGSIPANTWTHVVAVRDLNNKTLKVYVNGIYKTQWVFTKNPTSSSSPVVIGTRAGSQNFNGSISDVKIYNRALSAGEVTSLYNSYKPKVSSGSLQRGLVLDMPLDLTNYNSATNRTTDKTPYSNHGTNYGATVGSDSAIFDGSNDYVSLGSSTSLNLGNYTTIMAWVNSSSWSSTWPTIYQRSGQTAAVGFHWIYGSSSALTYQYANGTTTRAVSSNSLGLISNTWYHLAIVHDNVAKTITFYKNGENAGSRSYTDNALNVVSGSAWIGTYQGGVSTSYLWNGSISDARIYNRTLSAEEIKLLYDRGR